jgi:hypothetical protein
VWSPVGAQVQGPAGPGSPESGTPVSTATVNGNEETTSGRVRLRWCSARSLEFPGVPHRYGDNPFLRDVAKPVLAADSHAKVQMRRKVRGLRTVERALLKHQRRAVKGSHAAGDSGATVTLTVDPAAPSPPEGDSASDVVLDYCAAVRGILNR